MDKLLTNYQQALNQLCEHKDGFIYLVVQLSWRKYRNHIFANNYWHANRIVLDENDYGDSGFIYTNNKEYAEKYPYIYVNIDDRDEMVEYVKEVHKPEPTLRKRRRRRRRFGD